MKVLDALLEARTLLSLEQICVHTQLPKSTAFRIVVNLLQGQYLTETEDALHRFRQGNPAFWPEGEIYDWIRIHGLRPFTSATITDEDAFLQELRETRARGYAVDNCEYEAGVQCIAAPIRDRTGTMIAAVSISRPDTCMPVPRWLKALWQHSLSRPHSISRKFWVTWTNLPNQPQQINGVTVRGDLKSKNSRYGRWNQPSN